METIKTIKGYDIHERIGSGGFGVVHRAYQATVGREVAFKIILPHFANQPDFIRRFEAEAQIIARLEHPFIVPLYDYWRDPDGAYLVMRWLRGGNLREALANGPFGLEAAALLLDQMTSALALAHRNGIVHRDLKPSNILLDEDGNAYLSDFGIAKDTSKTESPLTGTGIVLGSPDYLSPEQARSEPVTPKTDIYSLGVMLYEVLTGQHPFPNVSSVERMFKHLNESLPLIETFPPQSAEGINAIIQKATAKNPAQRYTDVLEIAADFRRETDLSKRSPESIVEQLTLREQEILQMIVNGCSNKDIADQLFITVGTVKWHVRQLYQKLHVRSRVQAMMRARELNLIVSETSPGLAGATVSGSTFIALPEPENPYKGLRAFQTADARDFFGRERLIQRLIKRLGEHDKLARFLAVVGPSGSGKSSVVKAGLVPALWRGDLPGSERWFVIEMLPGTHPLDELEIALTRVAANQAGNLRKHLERDLRGLVRVAGLILPDDGSELLVIIDQFEEIFTLVDDEARRTQFLALVHAATTDPRSRVRVIITLRADFYDRPLNYPDFGELVRSRMETIMPLSADELEEAITKPAARVGISFESGLVSTITGDVHYQPGALPLLQYALTELFEQRAERILTHEAYQALGGATGALTKRSEDLYNEQPDVGREALRQMFLRLVTLGEGNEDTRRRVLRAELLAVGRNEDVMDEAIDTYAAYRLLTLDHDPTTRRPTVEIAHEAILREWERLRTWLNESRHDIRQQRLLAAAADEWQKADRDKSYLLQGARLDQFAGWAAETKLVLTQGERGFLDAGIAEHQRQETAEQTRQAKELQLQKRAANRLRYLVAGLAVFLVIAASLSVFAFDREGKAQDARLKAERQGAINHSLVLANNARDIRTNGNADLALQLALTAANIDNPSVEVQNTLRAIAAEAGTRAVLTGHSQGAKTVAFSPDGKTGLSGSCAELTSEKVCTHGELIEWDLQTYVAIRRIAGHTGWINRVAFSPDGQSAFSASDDHTLMLWDMRTGQLIRRFEGHTDSVNSVVFSPDGKTAISASSDKTLILWDVDTGEIVRQFQGHTAGVNSVVMIPDGRTMISGSDDTTAIRWDIATGAVLTRYAKHTSGIVDLAISPDGHTFMSAGGEGDYRLWDVESGAAINRGGIPTPPIGLAFTPDGNSFTFIQGTSLTVASIAKWFATDFLGGHSAPLLSAAVSPDGRFALTGSADKTVRLWNLKNQAAYRRFETVDELQLGLIVFSPDHRSVLSGTEKGHVIMWDVASGKVTRRFDLGQTIGVFNIAFTPDGKYMAVSAGAFAGDPNVGSLTLWDFETGQIVRRFEGQKGWILGIAFSPDGRTLLSGSSYGNTGAGELVLWDVATGAILRRFDNSEDIMYVTLSADGHQAVTGSWSRYHAILWDVATGKEIRRFDGVHTDATNFAVFALGEKAILTASYDSLLQEWDVATGKKLHRFTDTASAFGPSFSPDGRYMANGNGNGTATLWDFQTGDILQRIDTLTIFPDLRGNYVWSTIFDPSGKYVYFIIGDNVLHKIVPVEWSVSIQSMDALKTWIKANRYIRDLTCDERAQYQVEPLCSPAQ